MADLLSAIAVMYFSDAGRGLSLHAMTELYGMSYMTCKCGSPVFLKPACRLIICNMLGLLAPVRMLMQNGHEHSQPD